MQQNHVGQHEDKPDQTKERLSTVEEERDRVFHELHEARKMAEEANSRVLTSKNPSEPQTGLKCSSNEVRKMDEEANSRIDTALPTNNLSDPRTELNHSTKNGMSNEVRRRKDEEADSRVDVAGPTNNLSVPKTNLNSSLKHEISNEQSKKTEEANSRVDKALLTNNLSEPPTDLSSSRKDKKSKEVSKMTKEANSRVHVALPAKKVSEPKRQLNSSAKDALLSNMEKLEDMKENNNDTELLGQEAKKEFELRLAEKQASLDRMKKQMDDARAFEVDAMDLLSECKRRIHELEDELEKRKASEATLYESLVMQTKQLEQDKILLEESKLEIASLKEKIVKLQESASDNTKIPHESPASFSMKETEEGQEGQAQLTEYSKDAGEGEKLDSMKGKTLLEQMSFIKHELESAIAGEESDTIARTLLDEISYLKNELKLAMDAEENSKKAMDDLAMALKEVATEAHQTKEELTSCQAELQRSKEEADHLKALLSRTEGTYKQLLEEAKREADRNSNIAERLRLEAEESLMAWNTETTEFVNCIRRAEEERAAAQEENGRLQEMLREAENKTQVSKEENQKLRDILKQALNEANIAKEAAGIAQAENSQLKDMLGVRNEAMKMLTQENEMLKIHEAAAFENIKELKRLLAEAPIRELKNSEEDKEANKKGKAHKEGEKEHKEGKSLGKTISFNLKDIIAPNKHYKEGNEEINKETDDDDLRGSIFDAVDSASPNFDGDIVSSDEIDESQLDDTENNSRKRRALLRRFGDLIRRKGTQKKEPSISNDERLNTTPPHP